MQREQWNSPLWIDNLRQLEPAYALTIHKGQGSEFDIHQTYLKSLENTDQQLPYQSIVALNEKSAILHYQHKKTSKNANTLLIDAGARFKCYASDITRTYCKKETPTTFLQLLSGLEEVQQNICKKVSAGKSFLELHNDCHRQISELLVENDILTCSKEIAIEKSLSSIFFPHGLGHMLGIQVHDVGGDQIDEQGSPAPKKEAQGKLRMMRILREDEVITIEPGVYFIPSLLDTKRGSEHSSLYNWKLIDTLIACGGIRIEDNLHVKNKNSPNITRKYLPK